MADAEPERLLDGLHGSARAQRAELVDWLLAQGFSADEIASSPAPMLLPSRRLIGDDGRFVSARAIADESGVGLDLLRRVQTAIGLAWVDDPDAPVHQRADGDVARHARQFVEAGIGVDHALRALRVLADGYAHAAELMRSAMLAGVLEPGVTELQIAQRSAGLVDRLAPLLGPLLTDLLFTELRHQLDVDAINADEIAAGTPLPGARRITVAFADLVGFTSLGELVPPEQLVQLAERLTALARDVAVPPVRFIKTIGDAVMMVSTDPAPLIDAMLKLVEAAEIDPVFPRLRAGAATGDAVSRAGDWFGSPVNTASRVTDIARPGTVLVTEAVRGAVEAPGRFGWSWAGSRRLKGIAGVVGLYRVRHRRG